MIHAETSLDAKTLTHISTIFSSEKTPSDYGIHFIDVNGKNVSRKHSWANILESQVVSGFVI